MRKSLLIAAGLFILLSSVFAEFRIPALHGRVTDEAGLFSSAEKRRIEQTILSLENATKGGQMVVVTLKSLQGVTIEEAGIALGEKWKPGRKGKDDGAILIIVPSDHRMRLEIGYGWEGQINDARAGDIIRELAGFFKKGKYADGAVYAVAKVQFYLTGKYPGNIPERVKEENNDTFQALAVILFIILFLVLTRGRGFILFFGGSGRRGGGGGGFSGGGFSGGGGSFGGGGASGRW